MSRIKRRLTLASKDRSAGMQALQLSEVKDPAKVCGIL